MKEYIKSWLTKLLLQERSVNKLASAICLGTFIALSPTIPLQTPLTIALCWLFGLNIAIAVAVLYIVNNPFTLIPIYVTGYAVGVWFFKWVVRTDMCPYNPWWVERFNAFISQYISMEKYLGAEFCFWYLLVGGFLLALIVSLPLYPLLKRILTRLTVQLEKQRADL